MDIVCQLIKQLVVIETEKLITWKFMFDLKSIEVIFNQFFHKNHAKTLYVLKKSSELKTDYGNKSVHHVYRP